MTSWWSHLKHRPVPVSITKTITSSELRPSWRQVKLLPKTLTVKEVVSLFLFFIIFVISISGLGWRWYLNNSELIPKIGGQYQEGVVGTIRSLNPLFSSANQVDKSISQLIFSGLFKTSGKELINDLAESYTVSPDGEKYTITLKNNLLWSDGAPLDADDVVFTIQLIQDQNIKSPLASSLQNIKVEKVDNLNITLELAEPFAPFLTTLTFGILPRHIWQDITPANFLLSEYNTKPVSNGPYRFKNLSSDRDGSLRNYVIEINPYYHDPKPYLKTITFKFYPDFETAIQALKDNTIDGLGAVPLESLADINSRLYSTYKLLLPQYTAIFFNPQNNALLKDRTFRQALAVAINKTEILEQAIKDNGRVIDGAITEGALGYNENIKKYSFDPGWAEELLNKLGWEKKEDGIRYKKDEKLSLTLTIPERQEFIAVASMIKNYWQAVGIDTQINIVPIFQLQRDVINPRQYQLLMATEVVGVDPDPYAFWHSSQNLAPGLSLSIFNDPQIDKSVEEARRTIDNKLRAAKYADFQAILADQVYAIFLYSPTFSYVLDKEIKGVDIKEINSSADRFNDIGSWYRLMQRITAD